METDTKLARLGNLTREGTADVVAVYCLDCGRVYAKADGWAGRCCHRACEDCGTDIEKSPYVCCEPCRATREAARVAALVGKAVRVPAAEYDGPVYCDGTGNDGFSQSVDALLDELDGDAAPSPVWACSVSRLQLPSADLLVEDACENAYDDATDDMPPTDELQAAIDAYNARVTAEVWEPDHARLIDLDTTHTEEPHARV